MKSYDKNSWKEKIDPHFDKPVKIYIEYLSQIENLPNDGQIRVKDDYAGLIKNTNFTASYNHEFKKEIFRFNKEIGLWNERECKLFLGIIYSIAHYTNYVAKISQKSKCTRNIILVKKSLFFFTGLRINLQMNALLKIAEKLAEEESRQYYINLIKGFLSDLRKKPFMEIMNDFLFTTFSLFIRIACVELEKEHKTVPTKEKITHLKNPIILNLLIGNCFSTMSQIAHQEDMGKLLSNIRKGNDKSIFKALIIDKGLITYEPIANRINKAKISGDKEFLKKLSKAIEKGPLERIGQHGKTYAVLGLFWKILYKLNNFELYHFLEYCGLHPSPYPDGFDKFMRRYIKQNNLRK